MSPRPKQFRRVSRPPKIAGMKPYGMAKGEEDSGFVFLHFEEYEAIRLCDYEGLNHEEAAKHMSVSRPTLTRIYSVARYKISDALVLGKQLVIEGGKVFYSSEWYSCQDCGSYFNNPASGQVVENCPLCGSRNIISSDKMAKE